MEERGLGSAPRFKELERQGWGAKANYYGDSEGFRVPNVLNRFAVSSWMPFKYNADGSLDLNFQNESPGAEKKKNWLPAPKAPFNLTLRMYAPKSEALTRKWNPPPVIRAQSIPTLIAQ